MMQTATVVVSNKDTQIPTIKTRILMDTGSQRTYVTEEIIKQLQLRPSARESLHLAPENDHYGEILMSGKVEIDKGLYLLESKLGWILSG